MPAAAFLVSNNDWGLPTLERTGMCAQGMEHALRHGVDMKLSTDGEDCADRRDAYSGYLEEAGKWAHLPGGAVTLEAAVSPLAGVRSKAPCKRKAAEEDSDSGGEPHDNQQPHQ